MKILLGITGGIAAYKSIDVISALINKGHDVHVIMSDNAKNFCPASAVNVISKNGRCNPSNGSFRFWFQTNFN